MNIRLTRIEAENFKRLVAVSIDLDRAMTVIGGENDAGKSSVIDAIQAALGGKRRAPTEPLRRGSKKGHATVTTSEFAATFGFTEKKTSLKVTSEDGFVSAPQTMLDGLTNPLSFDPLEFNRQKPAEQEETLRRLAGLDFAEHDAERQQKFDSRTTINRDIKRLRARIDGTPRHPDAPDAEVSINELAAELEKRQVINQSNATARQRLKDLRASALDARGTVENFRRMLAKAERDFEEINKIGLDLKEENEGLVEEDVDEIRGRIATAETDNCGVRENAARQQLEKELAEITGLAQAATEYLEQMDGVKTEAIANAEFPIDGLGFKEDGGIIFNGLPFDQASQSERLRVSIAIGLAGNAKLRLLLSRDGSLLDDRNRALVEQMVEDADAQIVIECVGDDPAYNVILDDGVVRGATEDK